MKTTDEIIVILQSMDNPAKVAMLQALVKNSLENVTPNYYKAVKALTNDGDVAVRFWAKKVSSSLPIQDSNDGIKEEVEDELPLDVLLKKLEAAQSHFIVNEVLRKILNKRSPEIFQPLVEYLRRCTDGIVISFLVKNLGIGFPNDDTLSIIAPYLKHEDERVIANAVEGIEAVQSPKAVVFISQMLEHSNHRVKANAAKALAKQDPDTAREIISRMLQMKDRPHFVIAGCNAVKRMKQEKYLPELVNLLGDPVIGDSALDAIVGIGGEAAEGYLEAACEIEDVELKGKIQTALETLRKASQLRRVKENVMSSIHKGKDALVKIGESVKEKIDEQRHSKPQDNPKRVESDGNNSVEHENSVNTKIILGSGVVAFFSLFLNWVDVGIASSNGIQQGGFLFFFLISYPIYKAYKKESFNKPIAYGLTILSIFLMIGYIGSKTISMFGRSANASSSGAYFFLISLFGLLFGIFRAENKEPFQKDGKSVWDYVCNFIVKVKKNSNPSLPYSIQDGFNFLKNNSSLKKVIGAMFVVFLGAIFWGGHPTNPANSKYGGKLNYEFFEKIRRNSGSIERLLGSEGNHISSNGSYKTFQWKNTDGSTLTIVYYGGEIAAKSQNGLFKEFSQKFITQEMFSSVYNGDRWHQLKEKLGSHGEATEKRWSVGFMED